MDIIFLYCMWKYLSRPFQRCFACWKIPIIKEVSNFSYFRSFFFLSFFLFVLSFFLSFESARQDLSNAVLQVEKFQVLRKLGIFTLLCFFASRALWPKTVWRGFRAAILYLEKAHRMKIRRNKTKITKNRADLKIQHCPWAKIGDFAGADAILYLWSMGG